MYQWQQEDEILPILETLYFIVIPLCGMWNQVHNSLEFISSHVPLGDANVKYSLSNL